MPLSYCSYGQSCEMFNEVLVDSNVPLLGSQGLKPKHFQSIGRGKKVEDKEKRKEEKEGKKRSEEKSWKWIRKKKNQHKKQKQKNNFWPNFGLCTCVKAKYCTI